MSLLLRRPPGREAYPGDVFYLHSRLLERAARLNDENGGGSLTALPIIETQAGDVSAYIPTNVISITDGQIFLETDLFNAGQRPALNIGISVSRVGSARPDQGDEEGRRVRCKLDLAQYRELAAFAQFASDLDKATRDQLTRGEKLSEVIKQPQYQPLPVEKQVAILVAATSGALDDVPTPKVKEFETRFYRFLETERPAILEELGKTATLTDELTASLTEAIETFRVEAFGMEPRKDASAEPKATEAAADAEAPTEAPADRRTRRPKPRPTRTRRPTAKPRPPLPPARPRRWPQPPPKPETAAEAEAAPTAEAEAAADRRGRGRGQRRGQGLIRGQPA